MSHHLAGITARTDPRVNITDVYTFKGAKGPVFALNTNGLNATTGWHPDAAYEIHIDTDDDAHPNLTFTVTFDGDGTDGAPQEATLHLQLGPECDRDKPGMRIAQAATGERVSLFGFLRFYTGLRGDPFYISGPAVTAVREAVTTGAALDLDDFDPELATNLFIDTNVHSIVIEIDEFTFKALTGFAPVISTWGAVAVPNEDAPGHRQVDRSGVPLLATLTGFDEGDDFNATAPEHDVAAWGDQIRAMIAAAAAANGVQGDAEAYAAEIARTLVPSVLRYRVGTPADFTMGNGRGLRENAPEHMFALMLGGTRVDMGLGPDDATGTISRRFPYLADPIDAPKTGFRDRRGGMVRTPDIG